MESIVNQTYEDWEIVLVDDASTDNTQQLIEQLKSRYKLAGRLQNIRLDKRSGGAVARNAGINSARGEYIAFLDDDDEWLPEKLSKQVACLQKNNQIGICYTGKEIVKTGNKIAGFGKSYSFRYPPSKNHFRDIMSDNFVGITSSVIIPRSILLEVKGFDEKLPCFQDYELFIRILHRWKAYGINEPLVRYYLEKSVEHVSFTREKVYFASKYLAEKYKTSPYNSLLKRAIFIINLKKMVKSFSYTKEVFRFHFRRADKQKK
ncbi:MAG: glycosyltransferase family A protein [Bacteroidota bacterium]|nr:glycosyltransferase family A protein [Bacteroidota bacterium]MDP4196495.1 glycosyltransferase family A protein [Bacteroidota bacterium]